MLLWIICAIIGYLIGNFSTGTIIAKRTSGVDIRNHGSGSTGATNMLRVLGKKPAAITFVGDILKGVLACAIGYWIAGFHGALFGGFFAVVGHIWPVFYGFRGGKGVATSLGVMLCISPLFVLIIAPVAILIMALTKYVSLADILAAGLYGILVMVTGWGKDWVYVIFGVVLAAIVIFAHRTNIKRLLNGTENKLGSGKGKGTAKSSH